MNSRLYLAAVVAMLLSTQARSEDCGKLISYGTVPLTQVPGEAGAFVPVEIAGVPKLMLLDTGASITMIKHSAARELNLEAVRTDVRVYDVTGNGTNQFVSAPLKIAALNGDKVSFMLGTPYIDAVGNARVVGLLGADILKNFDISVDFGAQTFAILNSNHCDGQVVYWPERPIAVIPFKLEGDAIVLSVMLDGHEFKALLDTGASISTLEKTRAERTFDAVLGSADTPAIGDLNGKGATVWKHRFKSLSLAGIEVANPEIEIIPDKISDKVNTWSTGSMLDKEANSVEQPPMLLGMNVLKHLHVYIAYKERKLYITPAGKAPDSLPSSAAPDSLPSSAAPDSLPSSSAQVSSSGEPATTPPSNDEAQNPP